MDMIFCRGARFTSNFGVRPILATKHFLDTTRFMRCSDPRRWRFNKLLERRPQHRNLSCNYVTFFNQVKAHELPLKQKFHNSILLTRNCNSNATKGEAVKEPLEKLSTFGKMKRLTKDYWHIVVPVHIVTSLGWVALFYAIIKNGVDIAHLMEILHFKRKHIDMVKESTLGTWALIYLLYKIFTPIRYPVTLGGVTMAIRWLSKSGLVKPLPFGKQSQVMSKIQQNEDKAQQINKNSK